MVCMQALDLLWPSSHWRRRTIPPARVYDPKKPGEKLLDTWRYNSQRRILKILIFFCVWHFIINGSINQPIKQSITELVGQKINQSINQSTSEYTNQSINQSTSEYTNQSINQSIDQWVYQSINQSTDQLIALFHSFIISSSNVLDLVLDLFQAYFCIRSGDVDCQANKGASPE